MNFEGRWKTKNGDTYTVARLDRPGGMYSEGDEIYMTPDRADLRWDRNGDAIQEGPSIYKYYENQWNRAQDYDLVERISEKDSRR